MKITDQTKKCSCTNIAELSRAAVDRLRFELGAKEGKVRLACQKCEGDYWVTVRTAANSLLRKTPDVV